MKALTLQQLKEERQRSNADAERFLKERNYTKAFDSVVETCYLDRLIRAYGDTVEMTKEEGTWQQTSLL